MIEFRLPSLGSDMDDGRLVVINRNGLGNGIREGAYVRVDGTRIIPLR